MSREAGSPLESNGSKRKKRRGRFHPGEQAPGWPVHAARSDLRSGFHFGISNGTQPIRFAPARDSWQPAPGRSFGSCVRTQIESKIPTLGNKCQFCCQFAEDGYGLAFDSAENGCCLCRPVENECRLYFEPAKGRRCFRTKKT